MLGLLLMFNLAWISLIFIIFTVHIHLYW
jgi:hypothetical protein